MFLDNSLVFSSITAPVAITSTADSSVIDVTGAGVGVVPSIIGAGGLSSALGVDIGQGDGVAIPYVYINVPTTFTSSGSSATLQVSLKAAPDSGTGTEGTYTTLYTSAVFTTAQLAAGEQIIFQVPPRALTGQPGEALPRFYKLTYTVASGPFTAGKVTSVVVLNPPAGLVNTQYGSNFVAV